MSKKSATRKRLVSTLRGKVAEAAERSRDGTGKTYIQWINAWYGDTRMMLIRCRKDGMIALRPKVVQGWEDNDMGHSVSVSVPDWRHPREIPTRTIKLLMRAEWSPDRPLHLLELLARCAD